MKHIIKIWLAIAFVVCSAACGGEVDLDNPAWPVAEPGTFTQPVDLTLTMAPDLGDDAELVIEAVEEWNRVLGSEGHINLIVIDVSAKADIQNDIGKGPAYYSTKYERGNIWISNYTQDILQLSKITTAIGHALIGRVEYIDRGHLDFDAPESAVMREFNGGATQVTQADLHFVAEFRNYQR